MDHSIVYHGKIMLIDHRMFQDLECVTDLVQQGGPRSNAVSFPNVFDDLAHGFSYDIDKNNVNDYINASGSRWRKSRSECNCFAAAASVSVFRLQFGPLQQVLHLFISVLYPGMNWSVVFDGFYKYCGSDVESFHASSCLDPVFLHWVGKDISDWIIHRDSHLHW